MGPTSFPPISGILSLGVGCVMVELCNLRVVLYMTPFDGHARFLYPAQGVVLDGLHGLVGLGT